MKLKVAIKIMTNWLKVILFMLLLLSIFIRWALFLCENIKMEKNTEEKSGHLSRYQSTI